MMLAIDPDPRRTDHHLDGLVSARTRVPVVGVLTLILHNLVARVVEGKVPGKKAGHGPAQAQYTLCEEILGRLQLSTGGSA